MTSTPPPSPGSGAAGHTRPRDPDLEACAQFYREQLRWPVTADHEHARLIIEVGTTLDVLLLPARLGERTAAELVSRLCAGPVATNPGARWWTFITAPCPHTTLDLPPLLRTARALAVPRGGQALLPHPSSPAAWFQRPAPGQPLPGWDTVIDTAARIARNRHTQHTASR